MSFKINCAIFVLLFSTQHLFSQGVGSIKGNVSDGITGDGLPGADITVARTSFRKAADDKGNFELKNIPPGEYDLDITTVGYGVVHRHVTVRAGKAAQVFITAVPDGKSLEEVTVFGRSDREKEIGARDREKNASNMMNVISAQAMVRSPDINAANVLQRMSGVTVSRSSGGDEAYAVIRGMEPRYNNTLVNGIKIASPDNKNRYVQLDIIPSDILSSIEISKSLTADMEGDAIGGTVNMVVKDAPDKGAFKATASIGYSQLFFDEKFSTFSKSDIQSQSPNQRNAYGHAAQPGDFSRSNLDFRSVQAPPTGTLGFSYASRFMHNKIGVVLADNVQNQYYGNISRRFTVTPVDFASDSLRYLDGTDFKGYTQQLNNGTVAHLDYVFNERNKVNIDNFFVYSYLASARHSEDTTLVGTGRVGPGTGEIFPTDESYTQRQYVENLKVSGKHVLLPALTLDWAGVYSKAQRRVPDLADIHTVYLIKYDLSRTGTDFDDITHQWLKNDDRDYTGIVNLDYHKNFDAGTLQLKAGALYRSKTRDNNEDDYILRPPSTNSNGGAASKPAWTGIYNASWVVFNPSGTGIYNKNNYTADENVSAGYLMSRFIAEKWEAGAGVRLENTKTDWAVKVFSPTQPSSGNQTYGDVMPDGYLKYKLSGKQALHASYFRSISRPNYYELVPTASFAGDYYVSGNAYLLHSVADNLDLRYELFPKGEEHLFAGVFYKHIVNPIELRLEGASDGRITLRPDTSQPATNYGAEVSFTQYWGKLGFTGNYTYTHSSINAFVIRRGVAGYKENRPMQGQTDHIANVSLLYKDVRHGVFAQVAYEYQGKTLVNVNSTTYDGDYYQRPMNFLSVSAEKDIRKHFTVFGKFNNLLNTPAVQYVQNTLEVSRDQYRATYLVGIRYDVH
ncbi:MAG: outer membrane beta-barrel protein [Bacteroidetes bacterium]|nr:outer membrane beta-barrel protein [Bacteroidota bacterium]